MFIIICGFCDFCNFCNFGTKMTTRDDMRRLSMQIAEDPEMVYSLEPDVAVALRKYIHPLGDIPTTKKCYANLGVVNWNEKYLRKLHMTAMVGYMYRMLEEYEPEDMIEQERRKFAASSANSDDLAKLQSEHEMRIALIRKTSRAVIGQFLDRNFNFNPDRHLRGAHSENKADPERKDKIEAIREKCAIADTTVDEKLSNLLKTNPEKAYQYWRSHLLGTYSAAREATTTLKSVLSVILDPLLDTSDKQGILLKKYKELHDRCNDMAKLAESLATADTLSAWEHNPPQDVFHQFDRYLTNHYEQLRDVVTALYNEKPDIEFSITLYDTFKTPEAARDHRVQHEGEFRTDVLTIESGGVTLLGPFKENRERIDFYNKNTEVMKRMMEQLEYDHKLGSDLMEKQVRAQKKKNIMEAGPDAPGLAAYSKSMNVASELGAKKVLTKEETEKLVAARKTAQDIKEDYEVPDDAIQVDMFFPQVDADGNSKLVKSKFYTQAEAPTFMQNDRYDEAYQPKRGDAKSLDSAYKTQVITSRTGEKKEIRVAKTPKDVKK